MFYSGSEKVVPQLGENAMKVLRKRYLRGETPSEMFWRIASCVVEAERSHFNEYYSEEITQKYLDKLCHEFYNAMATLDFLPNSPTIMNAGRPLGQLSGCFVLPVTDSMDGIFGAIWEMAQVQKAGGGTGFSFSHLRPSGDPVSSTIGEASGPVSFMKAFNACTEAIKQGGARRGANMGILRVDHPDIMEFIEAKADLKELTNFNMSVGITNEFMECLATRVPFTLKFKGVEYAQIDPAYIWEKLVLRAWSTGEPGIIFIDRVNEGNPTPELGDIESTNPCGEQPLLPYESCNLGSINLAHMVFPKKVREVADKHERIMWDKLREVVWLATRFLDDVIDVNHYPLDQIREMTLGNRKIGLGVMGWADMLIQLEIPYDSLEALELASSIMEFIQSESHKSSREIAMRRGVFPNWTGSTWEATGIPMRNAATITIAPTGTLSVVAEVSSGIEPLFGLYYEKELTEGVTEGGTLTVLNPHLMAYLMDHNFSADEISSIVQYLKGKGTSKAYLIFGSSGNIFKCASDITPTSHIEMQAAFQKYTDNAVSKTINFDNSVTPDDINRALHLAYALGCKGVTVYRDGSRSTQPLTKGKKSEGEIKTESRCDNCSFKTDDTGVSTTGKVISKVSRLDEVPGTTRKVRTGCGSMYVTVNDYEMAIYEVLLRTGSTGGCAAFTDGTAKLISIALRYGVPVEELIRQLNSVRCDNFRFQAGKDPTLEGKSCPDVVGRVMSNTLKRLQNQLQTESTSTIQFNQSMEFSKVSLASKKEVCPECNQATLSRSEGCIKCEVCGFSKC